MPELLEPAQRAAPKIRTIAAAWIVRLRENLSAQYAEHAAPIAEPAEFTPETVRQLYPLLMRLVLTIESTD
jgi:hypothetical protein